MPFLSISRDKRGYETTALLHLSAGRRGQPRPRLLYWFRTPSEVRVGVTPLSESVRREIELRHQDLTFDWDRILAGSAGPERDAAPRASERPRTVPGGIQGRAAGPAPQQAERSRGRKRRRTPRAAPRAGEAGGVPAEDSENAGNV